ncbi:MAG: hypothetical protein HKN26_13600 [Acidimicrobiales bacterium]|nr:hypothetical protein [Acidimicrobiales bacterium]
MPLSRLVPTRPVVAVAVLVLGGACSSEPANPTLSSTTTALAGPSTATDPKINATVTFANEVYEFTAECYLPGDGNVDVAGSGFDQTGQPTELLIRRAPARPYVGIRAGGSLLEPALDAELIFTIEAGIVQAEAVEFVRDLDLNSGEGTPVGPATIAVTCTTYTDGSP